MMDSLGCLKSQKNGAPRVVIFYKGSDDLQVFIVADENLTIEISTPSPEYVIIGILSIYFAWHQSYPAAYKQPLDFFASKIFKSQVKANSGVGKFLRKLENSKHSLVQQCEEDKLEEEEDLEEVEEVDGEEKNKTKEGIDFKKNVSEDSDEN